MYFISLINIFLYVYTNVVLITFILICSVAGCLVALVWVGLEWVGGDVTRPVILTRGWEWDQTHSRTRQSDLRACDLCRWWWWWWRWWRCSIIIIIMDMVWNMSICYRRMSGTEISCWTLRGKNSRGRSDTHCSYITSSFHKSVHSEKKQYTSKKKRQQWKLSKWSLYVCCVVRGDLCFRALYVKNV